MSAVNLPTIVRPDLSEKPVLAETELHLYVLSLVEIKQFQATTGCYIDTEEEARASRFVNPKHGENFRAIRGMLRHLLASYLSSSPGQVGFDYAEHGKPYLRDHPQLDFNLSHSQEMAAFAFARRRVIGLDIEFWREQKNLPGMIRHVASPGEQQELAGLTGEAAQAAFYRLWTRKEAFIKAVGRGLGMGLRNIHIGTAATDGPLTVEYRGECLPEWTICDLVAPKAYGMALCMSTR